MPVSIDGMVVMPGDVILGDEDGVVAFDRSVAPELLDRVRQQEAREAGALAAIREGRVENSHMGPGSAPAQGAAS